MVEPSMFPIRPGLCSVTFRNLPPDEVIELAVRADLQCIEWGAHGAVPAHLDSSDLKAGGRLGERTRAAGLAVASFGSYLNFGQVSDAAARSASAAALAAAEALGAPRIRVWAGWVGSAEATAEHLDTVTRQLADCVALARARDITVGLEFHGGTLTDTLASTQRLLAAVPGLTSYWQPHQDAPDDAALADLAGLAERVSALHVFSWWPADRRLPLEAREGLWRAALAAAARLASPPDALIEFVTGDDPAQFRRDAARLTSWITQLAQQGSADPR